MMGKRIRIALVPSIHGGHGDDFIVVEIAYDKKRKVVTIKAMPLMVLYGREQYFDAFGFIKEVTISSGPKGITPKRAKELEAEARQEIAQRFGTAWDVVTDVCAKVGLELLPEYVITDEEFALLDTFDPEDL